MTHVAAAANETKPAPARGKRAQRRIETEAEIQRVAREHLATEGPAALSLRAIARELGMVSSGIYRYVDSRDELLTRLIVESYTSLAEHVRRVHDLVPPDDLEGRWDSIAFGLRDWGRAHPHDWALLYGSPVPGYDAPAERTTDPGSEVLFLLVALLVDAGAAGRLNDAPPTPAWSRRAAAATTAFLGEPPFDSSGLTSGALTRGIAAWTLLVGAVTSELFEQLGELPDPDALFGCVIELARGLVLLPH